MKSFILFIALYFITVNIYDVNCQGRKPPKKFGNDFDTKAKNDKFDFTKDKCATLSTKNLTVPNPCDSAFEGSNSEKAEMMANLFLDSLKAKDLAKLIENFDSLCKIAVGSAKCYRDLKSTCNNDNKAEVDKFLEHQERTNPIFTAIDGNLCTGSGKILPSIANKLAKTKFSDCFDDEKMDNIIAEVERFMRYVQDLREALDEFLPPPDPNNSTAAAITNEMKAKFEQYLMTLCKTRNSMMKTIRNYLEGCDKSLQQFMMNIVKILTPPESGKKCEPPSEDMPKFDPKDSNRSTIIIFGGFNTVLVNNNNVTTCTFLNGTNVTLFATPDLKITCLVITTSAQYTFLTECEVSIPSVDSIEVTGKMIPNGFKKNGKAIPKGIAKKVEREITFTRENDTHMMITDFNRGIYIKIFIFKSSTGMNIANLVMRIPSNILNIAVGVFTEDCSDKVNRGTFRGNNGRMKRAVSDAEIDSAGNYDVAGTGDSNAKSMGTSAMVSANALGGLDSTILKDGNMPIINVFALLIVALVSVIFRLI